MFQRCVGRISGILQKLVGLCSFLARSFFVYCRLKLLMSLAAMSVVDSEDISFQWTILPGGSIRRTLFNVLLTYPKRNFILAIFGIIFQFKLAFLFPGSRFQEALRRAIYAWKYDDATGFVTWRKLPLTNV